MFASLLLLARSINLLGARYWERMPRGRVEVVRQPLAVREAPSRTLEQQLVRFPRLVKFLARLVYGLWTRLPPHSQVRKAIPRHYVRGSFEALNRRDLEAAFYLYHADVESLFDRRMVSIGIEPVYRGAKARIDMQRRWNAEWGDWQFEPRELIDLCNGRVLVSGHLKGIGLSSGIAVAQECDFLFTLSAGQVIREQVFLDHAEALATAGLSDSRLSVPGNGR